MTHEKALALVLRVVEFSETSSVVTLFTREFGKIRGLAKGARRLKGPFESALDLLATCRIVFLRKSSDALDLITEARLERRFRPFGRDLACLYAGYYVAELLNELTDDSDPHPELFDVAGETLAALASPECAVGPITLRFELSALRLLGHLPLLEACVECGSKLPPSPRVSFGLTVGGVLCARCRPGKRQVVSLATDALAVMKLLATKGYEGLGATTLDRRTAGELRGLLNRYFCILMGRQPRMQQYLGSFA